MAKSGRAAGTGGGAPEETRGSRTSGLPSESNRVVTIHSMAGAIRETMRARLRASAKALLVIARPKSPRLTASGKEAFRDRNRKIGANTRRAVCVMLLPSLQS